MSTETVEELVEETYALQEPWQSRFLSLLADMATEGACNGRQPAREEIVAWLSADHSLRWQVSRLLKEWHENWN
jgi:hypothetical protein